MPIPSSFVVTKASKILSASPSGNPVRRSAEERGGLTARWRGHPFDHVCLRHGIGHRLTQPNHPWTNGQVERMNQTIKEATVKRFFYDTHEQLKAHLSDFIAAYNFARRLKTLRGLTPYEAICKLWIHDPDRFTLDSIHQMPGLNSWHTIYTRMNRWSKNGVLDQVFEKLQSEQIVRIKIEAFALDSTSIKVHPDGTGALKKTALKPSASRAAVGTPKFIWLPRMLERP